MAHMPPTGTRLDIMENVHRYFATGIGLITTKTPKRGPNVMAAEWTMQVSYDPMLIAVFIHDSPTYWNIQETGVFGVNMASDDQAELVNVAGGYSRTEIQKFEIPRMFSTSAAKCIDVPMIDGCTLHAECNLVSVQHIGDHIMVVGRVLSARFDEKKTPLIYFRGNYRRLSHKKVPSGRKTIALNHERFMQLKHLSRGRFVLKAAVAVIREDGKVLLIRNRLPGCWSVPFVPVDRGQDYADRLSQYLDSIGINAKIGQIIGLERVVFRPRHERKLDKLKQDQTQDLRANFMLFDCKIASLQTSDTKWFRGNGDLPEMVPRSLLR
jgi:flavin reductase (DIM6/NTAB) family NADH-FMN oxidoreductase RutF